jgi:hypothetical protein
VHKGVNFETQSWSSLKWFLFDAESESCVIHGWRLSFGATNIANTVSERTVIFQMCMVRAAALPTAKTIEATPTADILGSHTVQLCSLNSENHNCVIVSGALEWFSKRKCRLPINHGLYFGIWPARAGTLAKLGYRL